LAICIFLFGSFVLLLTLLAVNGVMYQRAKRKEGTAWSGWPLVGPVILWIYILGYFVGVLAALLPVALLTIWVTPGVALFAASGHFVRGIFSSNSLECEGGEYLVVVMLHDLTMMTWGIAGIMIVLSEQRWP
jgi:hypothetical protein